MEAEEEEEEEGGNGISEPTSALPVTKRSTSYVIQV